MLSQVRNFILQGWPATQVEEKFQPYCRRKAELSVLEGCVVWGSRVAVPPPGRASVLEELHDSHLGASKMKSLARAYILWPNTVILRTWPEQVLDQLGMVITAMEPITLRFCRSFLRTHVLDAYSKWLDVQIMKSITSENIIAKLIHKFNIQDLHGSKWHQAHLYSTISSVKQWSSGEGCPDL